MCKSVPQMPVRSTRISTSLAATSGTGTSSSHSPGLASRLTSAFISWIPVLDPAPKRVWLRASAPAWLPGPHFEPWPDYPTPTRPTVRAVHAKSKGGVRKLDILAYALVPRLRLGTHWCGGSRAHAEAEPRDSGLPG